MPKIKSLIQHPEVSMLDLPSDEIALAVVAQMADALKVENIKDASLFSAILSSDKSQSAANDLRPH
ncbi:MAG: hypothetical protein KC451_10650 [Amylibacter sp.]|nr:hypothetical protein [Amylibacter sp.]